MNAARLPRRWLPWVVHLGALFSISTEGIIGLVVPLWGVHEGLGAQQIGVLVALGSLGPLVLGPAAGGLCDHFGDRRVMLATALGVLLTALAYPLAGTFLLACAVQLLGGLFRGTSWVATQSYAVRFARSAERQRFLGRFSFFGSIGMLAAPLLAGWLVETSGLTAGFLSMAAWGAALWVIGWLLPAQPMNSGAGNRTLWRITIDAYRETLPTLLRPAIALIMGFTLLRLSAAAINASFYPVYLDAIDYSALMIGALLAVINATVSLGSLAAARLSDAVGTARLLWLSIALSVVSIALVPVFESPVVLVSLSALHGFGLGLSLPTLLSEIGRHTVPQERGLVIGLRMLFNRAGYMLVPVVLGLLTAQAGLTAAFLVTGGVLLASLAVTGLFMGALAPPRD